MASMIDDKAGRGEAQGSRRPRQQAKRSRRVGFSLTGEEYALLEVGGWQSRAGHGSVCRRGGTDGRAGQVNGAGHPVP